MSSPGVPLGEPWWQIRQVHTIKKRPRVVMVEFIATFNVFVLKADSEGTRDHWAEVRTLPVHMYVCMLTILARRALVFKYPTPYHFTPKGYVAQLVEQSHQSCDGRPPKSWDFLSLQINLRTSLYTSIIGLSVTLCLWGGQSVEVPALPS